MGSYTVKISSIEFLAADSSTGTAIESLASAIGFGSQGAVIAGHVAIVSQSSAIGFGSQGVAIVGAETIVSTSPNSIGFGSPGVVVSEYERIKRSVSNSIGFGSQGTIVQAYDGLISALSNSIGFGSQGIIVSGDETIVSSLSSIIGFGSTGETTAYVSEAPIITTGVAVFSLSNSIGFGSPGAFAGNIEIISSVSNSIGFGSQGISIEVFDPETSTLSIRYKLVLTGINDGLSDFTCSISSFQVRIYKDTLGFLSMVIPGLDYVTDIANRDNGEIELWMYYTEKKTPEIIIYQERIIATQLDNIDIYKGSKNKSLVLYGYESDAQKAARITTVKTISIDDSWIRNTSTVQGLTIARLVKPHPTLTAGDTIDIDSSSFIVRLLTWTKSESNQTIQINE